MSETETLDSALSVTDENALLASDEVNQGFSL